MPQRYTPPTLREHAVTYSRAVPAFLWRRLLAWRTTFVAVSGSNGKTTTKEALSRILECRGRVLRTQGNFNNALGVCRVMLGARPSHRHVVTEMGISRPGQLAKYSRLYAPDLAVLTRVSLEHRENIGSIENIAREKAGLLVGLRPGGTAVLNIDDPFVSKMRPPAGCKTVWFGRDSKADVRVLEASSVWPDTLRFRVEAGGESAEIRTKLVGEHWIYAVAAAVAAAWKLGVSLSESAAALESFEPHRNRLEPVRLPNGAVLWRDDGLATLPTLEVALEALRRADVERRWLITGDVSFLEEDPVERRQAYARWLAPQVGRVVFVGEHSDKAADAAREAGVQTVRHFERVADAACFVLDELGPGDLALVKSYRKPKLARLSFACAGSIACERIECDVKKECDDCPELGYHPRPDAPKNLNWTPRARIR